MAWLIFRFRARKADGSDANPRKLEVHSTVPHEPPPRYLFLMRHAKHKEGHLTEEGAAHIRSLAMRFTSGSRQSGGRILNQTIRVWFTTTSTEVQERRTRLPITY